MIRSTSRCTWVPSRYAYGHDLRVRVDLPPGVGLPDPGSQTVWIGRGPKAIRIRVDVVDRSDTPWAHHGEAEPEPQLTQVTVVHECDGRCCRRETWTKTLDQVLALAAERLGTNSLLVTPVEPS